MLCKHTETGDNTHLKLICEAHLTGKQIKDWLVPDLIWCTGLSQSGKYFGMFYRTGEMPITFLTSLTMGTGELNRRLKEQR